MTHTLTLTATYCLALGLLLSGCSDSDTRLHGPGITTAAGSGTVDQGGFGGDGGPAVSARLQHPLDIAVDSAGNLYIADTDNHRIRKVDAHGIITTFAGDGDPGFGGDGGPATAAQLFYPQGVAVDSAGNVYIADTDNQRIRLVDSGGDISTVAGDGEAGFQGDGGPAAGARLFHPTALRVGPSGDVLFVDARNNRIRRIRGGVIETVAGNGIPGAGGDGGPATSAQLRLASNYYRLGGLAIMPDGTFYIADSGNHVVRRVDGSGIINRVVGRGTYSRGGDGGPAADAGLAFPTGLAVSPDGYLFVADTVNQAIRKVDTVSWTIGRVAGTGAVGDTGDDWFAHKATLRGPMGLAFDEVGDLLFADVENNRIRKVFTSEPN